MIIILDLATVEVGGTARARVRRKAGGNAALLAAPPPGRRVATLTQGPARMTSGTRVLPTHTRPTRTRAVCTSNRYEKSSKRSYLTKLEALSA